VVRCMNASISTKAIDHSLDPDMILHTTGLLEFKA
jgi:hypothetical protein